jgi:hypothetical protein
MKKPASKVAQTRKRYRSTATPPASSVANLSRPQPQILMLEQPKPGQTRESVIAEAAAAGLASNAMTTVKLSAPTFGALDRQPA